MTKLFIVNLIASAAILTAVVAQAVPTSNTWANQTQTVHAAGVSYPATGLRFPPVCKPGTTEVHKDKFGASFARTYNFNFQKAPNESLFVSFGAVQRTCGSTAYMAHSFSIRPWELPKNHTLYVQIYWKDKNGQWEKVGLPVSGGYIKGQSAYYFEPPLKKAYAHDAKRFVAVRIHMWIEKPKYYGAVVDGTVLSAATVVTCALGPEGTQGVCRDGY
jgi:hypothetical protein